MSKRDERASREMVTQLREEVKSREKAIIQRLMAEERELFLEENPEDKGNGFYERSLLTHCGHENDEVSRGLEGGKGIIRHTDCL